MRSGAGPPASVTVVIPAYNVERYLPDCIDSLRTNGVWEQCRAIVVDDGSTDGTRRIADGFAAQDPRITVITQPNSGPGPGAARNHGLDLVETDFVLFCDGDDEMAPGGLERLLTGIRRFDAELAVGASEQFPQSRSWLWTRYFVAGRLDSVPIEDVPLLVHNAATGNKLFRTAALRAGGRRFAERIHHQDTVVTIPAMLFTPRIALIGDVVHRYRKREEGGSIMDSHFTRIANYWDHLQVIETLSADLDSLPENRRPLLEAFLVRSFQGFAMRASAVLPADRLREFFERSSAVISRVSSESIMTATRQADERAAYVTMLERDYATFCGLGEHLERLVADDGDLYLDLPTSSAQLREMVRCGATRAQIHSLRVSPGSVEFDLAIRIRGARSLANSLTGTTLRIQQSNGSVALVQELSVVDDDDGVESHAHVELARTSLAPGRYRLRLGFHTPTGDVVRWVRRPTTPVGDGYAVVPPERAGLRFRGGAILTSRDDRALLVLRGRG